MPSPVVRMQIEKWIWHGSIFKRSLVKLFSLIEHSKSFSSDVNIIRIESVTVVLLGFGEKEVLHTTRWIAGLEQECRCLC